MKSILVCLLVCITSLAHAAAEVGTLRVEVTSAASGLSIAGASVVVEGGTSTVTDSDGVCDVSGIKTDTPYRKVTVRVIAPGYDDYTWRDVEVYPGQTTILPFRLSQTGAAQVIEEAPHAMEQTGPVMNAAGPFGMVPPEGGGASALGPLPAYIRVWRKAKSDAAGYTIVENIPFEEYVKGVVPSEWFASWNAESLKAGCVAARSYGWYKVLHPRYPSIGADVSDTTATQVYRDSRADSTNKAADATRSQVMTWNGTVINAEYSAENADPTTAGPFPYQPSVSDPVCAGKALNGHGRGLCQWGSQRWAIGAPGSNGPKTYDWILNHYYGSQAVLQTAGGGLAVGDCAMVEGGSASVRSTPNGAYLATLPANTQVHVLEGPVAIGVSRWWRIAWPLPAPTRSDGWVTDNLLVEIPCPPFAVSVTGIAVSGATATTATVHWTTNVQATSVVRYGLSANALSQTTSGLDGIAHAVALSGLQPNTTYFYQVESAATGYVTTTSAVQSFTTPALSGDVDGDGAVTLADAALALRIAAGMEGVGQSALARADMFGPDGYVTLEDALSILLRAVDGTD